MKRKNLLSGLLAGALVLTSVFVPGVKNVVNAEEYDLNEGLVASFSFDDENLKDSQGGEDASAIVTGLSPYTGRMEYVDGYDGGKGIQLGDYGLKLNRENLREKKTVSLWIKPDNTIQADQATLFLGYHNPENGLQLQVRLMTVLNTGSGDMEMVCPGQALERLISVLTGIS